MSTTPTDAERAQLIERLKNHGRLGHRSNSIADVHEAARLLEAARALPVDGLDAEPVQPNRDWDHIDDVLPVIELMRSGKWVWGENMQLKDTNDVLCGTTRKVEMKMYDVIAVNMTTHKVRLLGENKTERNADAIEMMAVARLGCDEEFFTKAPTGKYKEGDEWGESDEDA
jgi:hypothetical protein